MYAKLNADKTLILPPPTFKRPDGSTVIGYDEREDLQAADGWLLVVPTPEPDAPAVPSYSVVGGQIVQAWTLLPPPIAPTVPAPLVPFAKMYRAILRRRYPTRNGGKPESDANLTVAQVVGDFSATSQMTLQDVSDKTDLIYLRDALCSGLATDDLTQSWIWESVP